MKKNLYFEGAGTLEPSLCGDVGDTRIRSAFTLRDGKRAFVDIDVWQPNKLLADHYNSEHSDGGRKIKEGGLYLRVDSADYITDDIAKDGYNVDDENKNRINIPENVLFDWSLDGVLAFVRYIGGDFDEIVCLPKLAGYSVFKSASFLFAHGNTQIYNYGDQFTYNPEQTARRIAKFNELYAEEQQNGEKNPNFSFYVDSEDPDYCIKCINNGERYVRYHIPA